MFGNASLPSKIFSYGAKRGPFENVDECCRQLRAAHRYRNKLVEIEKNRRAKRDAILQEMFPQLSESEAKITELSRTIGEVERAIKDRRSGQHLRIPATKEEKQRLKSLRAELKAARLACREMKGELRQRDAAQERLKAADDKASKLAKEARASCGVFWGTYLQVEQAIQQAKKRPEGPQFRPFRGDGKLAVQIQNGMTVEELFGCEDTRARLEPLTKTGGSRGKAVETILWLRIGSEGKRQLPVWAKFRVRLDRPLPLDCRIKWVFAVARKVATKTTWQIQFVVSQAEEFTREGRAQSGAAGGDVGWRMVADGLRVACFLGTDVRYQEIVIPASHMRQWAQVEDLRSIRDTHFNEAREILAVWRSAHKDKLPEWFRERTQHLRQWRAPGKLAALAIFWRANRIAGDDVVFAAVEAWRKKDKHLYEWEGNLRRKAAAWRKDFYRNIAAELAKQYRHLGMEAINLKESFARLPKVEKDDKAARLSRRNRTIAALGELRLCLLEAFGAECIVKVDPKYTSKRCHKCGQVGEYPDPSAVEQTCPNCLAFWDRDYNAASNILAATLKEVERSGEDENPGTAREPEGESAEGDATNKKGGEGEGEREAA